MRCGLPMFFKAITPFDVSLPCAVSLISTDVCAGVVFISTLRELFSPLSPFLTCCFDSLCWNCKYSIFIDHCVGGVVQIIRGTFVLVATGDRPFRACLCRPGTGGPVY